jgi:DNA-binding GntR family transcriptional regulator
MGEVPEFDPHAGPPAYMYVRVANHLAARIEAGDLAAGHRLPSEKDLAATYKVAVGTIRQALDELRRRGLVSTLPGAGTFVTEGG